MTLPSIHPTGRLVFNPLALGLALTLFSLPALPAQAASKTPGAEATSLYQRDLARCRTMREHGERANCLSEASTANAARQPSQADIDPGRYARNAVERCKALPGADRSDCEARIQGKGTTSGSVEGGGIYRELVTREPAPAPAATKP